MPALPSRLRRRALPLGLGAAALLAVLLLAGIPLFEASGGAVAQDANLRATLHRLDRLPDGSWSAVVLLERADGGRGHIEHEYRELAFRLLERGAPGEAGRVLAAEHSDPSQEEAIRYRVAFDPPAERPGGLVVEYATRDGTRHALRLER